MAAPEGYTLIDFVGYVDKGGYIETETYMENDLVHAGNTVWRCLVDNTTGVEPVEGTTWTLFIEGEKHYEGTYATFPRPPLAKDKDKFFVDIETDPRLMYTWDDAKQDYVLTGGAGGADGSSVDIPLTLPATGWTGATAPYSQTVIVPQMREGMTPFVTLTDSDTLTDAQRYAYSLLTDYDAAYASMTFYAADKPTVDILVTLKGVPAQEPEFVDNTVVLIVEPSGFALSTDPAYDGRYVSTITCEGMSAGAEGASWDIVRSGPVLTLEESKIAASITDVKPMDGAVQIVCTEVPAATYLLKITGSYADATPGDVILPNLKTWIENINSIMFTPVGYRNNFKATYLGNVFTDEQKWAIAQDKFTGMNVGSFWEISGIKYRVGDINYWIGTGDTECATPHLVIVPDCGVGSPQKMNDTNTTSGGYYNSSLRKSGLNEAGNIITNAFGSNSLLNHRELLTNAVTDGYPSGGAWANDVFSIMNEPMVYGSYQITPASNGTVIPYRYTIDKTQLSLFKLHPEFIISKKNGQRESYWLRDVASAYHFVDVNYTGCSNGDSGASTALAVRPVFGIIGEEQTNG